MMSRALVSSRAVTSAGYAASPPIGGPASSGRWPSSMNTGEPLGVMRHLSTPPITGSIDATAEMASATMPPSHMAATACRFVNDGSR